MSKSVVPNKQKQRVLRDRLRETEGLKPSRQAELGKRHMARALVTRLLTHHILHYLVGTTVDKDLENWGARVAVDATRTVLVAVGKAEDFTPVRPLAATTDDQVSGFTDYTATEIISHQERQLRPRQSVRFIDALEVTARGRHLLPLMATNHGSHHGTGSLLYGKVRGAGPTVGLPLQIASPGSTTSKCGH